MAAGESRDERGGGSRATWRWSALAGMASYLDAGSIVALGAGLALWQEELGLGNSAVGFLPRSARTRPGRRSARSSGGTSATGSAASGSTSTTCCSTPPACCFIVFAANAADADWGTVIVAIAVRARTCPPRSPSSASSRPRRRAGSCLARRRSPGASGPWSCSSWRSRSRRSACSGSGSSSRNCSSSRCSRGGCERVPPLDGGGGGRATARTAEASPRELLRRPHVTALLFTGDVNLTWNLAAGTNGIFLPYILRTVGSQSPAASVALPVRVVRAHSHLHSARLHALLRPRLRLPPDHLGGRRGDAQVTFQEARMRCTLTRRSVRTVGGGW